jgi:UDP-3-O-[3-hydroxymyristoyl] glucosamine N-acyltransferase
VQATVQQLAILVQGTIQGHPDLIVQAARPLSEAGPGDITFLETERHLRQLKHCRAAALVISPALSPQLGAFPPPDGHSFSIILVSDPLLAFITIVQHLHGKARPHAPGISPKACVHPTARLGPDCVVLPFAVISENAVLGARCLIHSGAVIGRDCRLGDDVVLHPNVVLYDGVVTGNRVAIHANAVIGADGFGYRFIQGRHVKVPQLGHVEIGDDVEIGACSTIDRGTFQPTRIGAGTRIDNLVQIAHNCTIGQHNLLCSQVGIAGSSTTGNYVVLAGQVGVADHLYIGDGAVVGAHSGVAGSVAAGERVLGYPAYPEGKARRMMVSLRSLPGLLKKVRRLEQAVGIESNDEG